MNWLEILGKINDRMEKEIFVQDTQYEMIYGWEYLRAALLFNYFCPHNLEINSDELDCQFLALDNLKKSLNSINLDHPSEIRDNFDIFNHWKNLKNKILWINLSFWDTKFGRMPLLACVKEKKDIIPFKNFWCKYSTITRNQRQNDLYTINDFVSRCNQPKDYIISFKKDNDSIIELYKNIEIPILEIPEQCDIDYNKLEKKLLSFAPGKNIVRNINSHAKVICNCRELWLNSSPKINYIYFFVTDLSLLIKSQNVEGSKAISIVAVGSENFFTLEEFFFFKILSKNSLSRILLINFSNRCQIECDSAILHALRSAVATIMGRNISHNIGSHVMARISTGGIDGWTTNEKTDVIIKNLNDEKSKKDIIHWSKDIQFLSRYIQQRMDFIAQIATDWPTWAEPAYLMNDLMRWFLSQKHLLNNIAASEGLKAHLFPKRENEPQGDAPKNENGDSINGNSKPGDIRFNVFLIPENRWNNGALDSIEKRLDYLKANSSGNARQGENKCIIHTTKYCESCTTCRSALLFTPATGKAHCRLDEDIPLAIPGGIIGYHAFYIILENIIRNGAKHDYTRRKQGIGYHFDVVIEVLYDPEEKIAIQTQRGNEKKKIPALLFRIYNNTSKLEEGRKRDADDLVKRMNKVLRTSIITKTGELNKGNWGLSEMKIAAGFLQQRDIAHIGNGKERVTGEETNNFKMLGEDNNGSDTIIKAVESPIGTLGYEFYIPKPRTVGIVCRKGIEEKEEKLGEG